MKTYTSEELKRILENHGHWIRRDCAGWQELFADLSYANLSNADLSNADLSNADFTSAYLFDADLSNANLSNANLYGAELGFANLSEANLFNTDLSKTYLYGADLTSAILRNADLYGADLRLADLCNANLFDADLSGANLHYAELSGANLYGADLTSANLSNANLFDADLSNANLYNTYLYGADLRDVRGLDYIPMNCPEEGSFVGWKKIIIPELTKPTADRPACAIAKLEIPAEARRSSAIGRECRAEFVKVLELQNTYGETLNPDLIGMSSYPSRIKAQYKVGEIVKADKWDEDRWNECTHGIHFFINRREAIRYRIG